MSTPGAADIYHDIYDFSIFPVSLGDILMWVLKSALRAEAVGRSRVHIHLVCDPKTSGFSPLQGSDYLADLFIAEATPAFYSHPYFSGLSVYRSRDDYRRTFAVLAKEDEISAKVYAENESVFQDRTNYDRVGDYFFQACSSHADINAYFEKHHSLPRLGYLEDCLVDWRALRAQFPPETFWVSLQFRLRRLDGGMPVNEEGLRRDAPFLTWYNFIREAQERHPFVRFVVLGRLQEKPLELLRLPNVTALRPLGMNLGHEITALLNSNLFLGSLSGFAPAAQFTDLPYDVFNCTPQACKNFGIAYGDEHLPNAVGHQKMHYGEESSELLLQTLDDDLKLLGSKMTTPDANEVNRTATTSRFFISDEQSDLELSTIFSSQLRGIALTVEKGDYSVARRDLEKLSAAFPKFTDRWPEFAWLSLTVEELSQNRSAEVRNNFLKQVASFCHPSRLVRRHGRYFENLSGFQGLQREGWCEKKTTMIFGPSEQGDFVVIQVLGLPSSAPTRVVVTINQQHAIDFVLLNEYAVLEIPVVESCIPTCVTLEADQAFSIRPRDETLYAFQIEGAGLVTRRAPMRPSYLGDKREAREKLASGIYSNGSASNLVRIRIDHSLPDDVEIMIHLVAQLPRPWRKGQVFTVQINDGERHEAFVTGKFLEAFVACPGRPRQLGVTLRFRDRDNPDLDPTENRATIKSLTVVPAKGRKTEIRSGFRTWLRRIWQR